MGHDFGQNHFPFSTAEHFDRTGLSWETLVNAEMQESTGFKDLTRAPRMIERQTDSDMKTFDCWDIKHAIH
jgi:hypothetical protein